MRDLIPFARAILVPRPPLPTARLARLLLAVLLAGSAPACTTWRTRPVPEPRADAPRRVEFARVTMDNGDVEVLEKVRVTQDSVFGRTFSWRATEVALPRSEVKSFEVRRIHGVATGAVTAAFFAAAFSYLSPGLKTW